MKCSQTAYGCEDVEPHGFVSLMDLYGNNFIRIRKLIPALQANIPPHHQHNSTHSAILSYAVSRVDGCLDLHCHLLEQTKYTTTFVLTYYFAEPDRQPPIYIAEPQLHCRVYHDACLVEVLTGHLFHGRLKYDHLPASAIKIKWQLNRLLYKWLGYCLYSGHLIKQFESQPTVADISSTVGSM